MSRTGGKIAAKRIVLHVLALAGYLLLLPLWRLAGVKRRGELRILTYHSVGRDRRHETNVDPAAFERQMRWISEFRRVAHLPDVVGRDGARVDVGDPAVALTFDDGYADNVTTALPVLEEFGLRATIFATAGYIGAGRLLPHDTGSAGAELLSWDALRRWRDRGMGVGSHGMSHARLGGTERGTLRCEVSESKQRLEEQLGEEVLFISFPYGRRGDFSDAAVRAAGEAGYAAAFSAVYGANTDRTGRWRLRRIGIESSDSLFTFRAKLNGALDLLALAESPPGRWLVNAANRLLGA